MIEIGDTLESSKLPVAATTCARSSAVFPDSTGVAKRKLPKRRLPREHVLSTSVCSGCASGRRVRRRHIRVPAANWPASCGPSFGLFRRPLAVFEGPLLGALPARVRGQSKLFVLASSEAMNGRHGSTAFCALARRRASQRQAGARRACLSTGMCEFAPARLAREAQGSFGNRKLPKPSCRAHGFGHFCRNKSGSLAEG